MILELARILAARGPGSTRHDLIFLLVDGGEEYGLLGAEAFIAEHPWADDVVFALNLDSGGNDGLATLTRTSADNGPAIAALAVALGRPSAASLTATAYALTPYDTDFSAYDRAGIFALDLGIGEDKAPYHTPIDRLEAVDPRSIQHLGESALAAIAALDSLDRPAIDGAGDRVYLDLGGRALWSCPAAAVPGSPPSTTAPAGRSSPASAAGRRPRGAGSGGSRRGRSSSSARSRRGPRPPGCWR
ncbi:MAG: M28 family peptidase [Myxococcales bacterium]|nr:M28 family peptidase [Myxococcales bacterium]